jgi:hypothetical protein
VREEIGQSQLSCVKRKSETTKQGPNGHIEVGVKQETRKDKQTRKQNKEETTKTSKTKQKKKPNKEGGTKENKTTKRQQACQS